MAPIGGTIACARRHFSVLLWLTRASIVACGSLHPAFADASPAITVNGTPASKGASVTVVMREAVTVGITGGPAHAGDWVGLYAVDSKAPISFQYLNGSTTPPESGVATATLGFLLSASGDYEFRFVAPDFSLLATSPPVTVLLPASGNSLAWDPFTDKNEVSLTEHAPLVNQSGMPWTVEGVSWARISSGRAYAGAGSGDVYATTDVGASDITISVDCVAGAQNAQDAALVFRYFDQNNHLKVLLDYQGGLSVWRRQNGVWGFVATAAASYAAGNIKRLQVSTSGATIKVFLDGVLKIQTTETFNQTMTRHGLVWHQMVNTDTQYDDLLVTGALQPHVNHITVRPASSSPQFGTTQVVTASAYDAANVEIPNMWFTWSTSNTTVATIPASGPQSSTSVTALGLGTVTITATSQQGVAGTTSLTIVAGDIDFYDRFSGANGMLLSAHTADLNRLGAGWVLEGGTPRLSDGLLASGVASGPWQNAILETTAADLTLATDWRAGAGRWCGLIVRYTDDNNRLMVVCDQNMLALWRRQGGNWTVVQAVSWPVTSGTTHHLQATLAGSSIQVWADGVLLLQVTESFNVAATRHGLGWAPGIDPETAYDNFEIRGNLPAAIARIVVSPASPALTFGTSQAFVARAYDAAGGPINAGVFTWSTSNTPVLGLASAVPATSVAGSADGLGTATVTATASNGVRGSTSVTVGPGDFLFYDRFSGTNGTLLSARNPDLNRLGTGWVLLGGTPRLSDGLAMGVASSTWENAILETTAADLTLSTDWRAGSGDRQWCGVILRYTDDDNHLMVVCDQNTLALWRRQAGNWSVVQSLPWPVTAETTHPLRVTLAGSLIQVWADGVLTLEATESFNVSATRHGLGWAPWIDSDGAYDNFRISGTLPPAIASVVVKPGTRTLAFGATQTFVASAFDAMGQPINAGVFAWTTSNPVVLDVPAHLDPAITATGKAPGSGRVIATAANGVSGAATVTVDSAGILIHDSFLDVDGTWLSSHQPDIDRTGGTWIVVGAPMPRITAEQLTRGSLSVIESKAANVTVGVDWQAGTGFWPYGELVLRYTDSANHLRLIADQGTLALWRHRAGVSTLVSWAALPITPESTHRLQAVLNGSSIQASVDGVALFTASESFNQTATRHGLTWSADPDAAYDNFDIVGISSGSGPCGMSISPTDLTLGTAASSGTLRLLASAASCGWRASSDAKWITPTQASGTGSAAIGYTVQKNTGTWGRSAHLTVAGRTIPVTQNGIGCQYQFSPSTIAVGYPGVSGSFTVTAPAGCAWDARNSSPWMTLYNYIGNGNGRVDYVIGENGNTQSRGWYVKVNSEDSVWFDQAGNGCESVSLSSPGAAFGGSGGGGNFNVMAAGGCAWHVETVASWIQTTSSGNGSGSVAYTVYENPDDAPRSGTLTIANATYAVYQQGGGSGGGEPSAVTVTLTSPVSKAVFTAPATVLLAADATTTNNGIGRVDFYVDGSLVGSANSWPYQSSKMLSTVGTHSVRAWAMDTSGAAAMSAPLYVVIRQASSGSDQPVVFAHGLASGPGTWDPVAANLQQRLHITSFKYQTPSTGTYEDQAASLESSIAALGSSKIVVGHSNGGIVAREVSKYESLKGIVTIGTPHRGVPLLNHVHDIGRFSNEALLLMGQIADALGAKPKWWGILSALQGGAFGVVSDRVRGILLATAEIVPSVIFPVTSEMSPDSPYLAALNSQQNRDRERSAVPIRVGIINTARHYAWAGPFRLMSSDAAADLIGDTMHAAAIALIIYSGQLRNSVSDLPVFDPERQETEALAFKLDELSSWLVRVDPLWCAWVSTVGEVNQQNPDGRQCLENDELVPAWSQLYPDAFNRRVTGAPHTRETTESEDTLYEILTTYLQVSPRTGDPPPVPTDEGDSLYPGETLYPGQSRDSSDGRFHLVYQGDGNLVLYNQSWSALWSSNTVGAVGFAVMQGDGNFVVYDAQGTARWYSNSSTAGIAGAYLVVRSDGSVVIYTPAGVPIWSTGPL